MAFETSFVFSIGAAALVFAYIASSVENKPVRVLFFGLSAGLGLALVGSNYAITEALGGATNSTAVKSAIGAAFYPTVAIVGLFMVYMFLSIVYNLFRPKKGGEIEQEEREAEEEDATT